MGVSIYGARRTQLPELPDVWFASQTEATRARQLLLMEQGGLLTALRFHPSWKLGRKPYQVRVTLDSQYRESGHLIIEDVKPGKNLRPGERDVPLSRDFSVRLKWLLNEHPELTPRIVRARGRWPSIWFEEVQL